MGTWETPVLIYIAALAPLGRMESLSADLLEVINTCKISIEQTQHITMPHTTNTPMATTTARRQPPLSARRTSSAPTPVRPPLPPFTRTPIASIPARQSPPVYQATVPSVPEVSLESTNLPGPVTGSVGTSVNPPKSLAEAVSEVGISRMGSAGVSSVDPDRPLCGNTGRSEILEVPFTRSKQRSQNISAVKVVVPVLNASDDTESDDDESEGDRSESGDDVSSDSDASSSDESFAPESQKEAKTVVVKARMDGESSDSDTSSATASTAKSAPKAPTPPSSPPSLASSNACIPSLPDSGCDVCPVCQKQGISSTHAGQPLLWCQNHHLQSPIRLDTSTTNEAPEPPRLSSLPNGAPAEASEHLRAELKPLKPPPSMGDYSLKRCQQRASGVTDSESDSNVPVPRKRVRVEPRKSGRGRKQ